VPDLDAFPGDRTSGRLAWPAPSELDPERREVYERIAGGPRAQGPQLFALTDPDGRLQGPFNAMLVSPGVGTGLQELGVAVRYRTSLTDRTREIAILALAAERQSEFEWYAHERVGRHVGLQDEELEALATLAPAPATFDADEAVVYDTVLTLARSRDLNDTAYAAADEQLGAVLLQELITLVGYYDVLALSLRVWRTPLPDGVPNRFDEAVPG
jgi:4-carboxymuconolactone decarboxylase